MSIAAARKSTTRRTLLLAALGVLLLDLAHGLGLHVLGACLVWIATLFIPPALRSRGESVPVA